MKKALSLLALISLALPLQSQAKPVSATLYPQGAMVTEEEVFRLIVAQCQLEDHFGLAACRHLVDLRY